MADEAVELTIGEMIRQVPEGQTRVIEPILLDKGQERYFQVWQNWNYKPDRLDWLNRPLREDTPWNGTRTTARIPVTRLPTPDVCFKGPSKDVVDFYGTGGDFFFISDALFRLINEIDPGSLEHIQFRVRARDAELPFHAVTTPRVLEAIGPRRTKVVIKDEDYAGTYFRTVQCPDGIVFHNDALQGVASFSDVDVGGWYWAKDLIALARARGIRGLYFQSVASSPAPEIERL
jgi:hypothetical protein